MNEMYSRVVIMKSCYPPFFPVSNMWASDVGYDCGDVNACKKKKIFLSFQEPKNGCPNANYRFCLKDIQHMFVTVTAMDKKILTPQMANQHEQVCKWGQAVNMTCSAPSTQLPSWFSTFPSKSHHDVCLLPWSNHCSMLVELPKLNSRCSTGCIPPAGYQSHSRV
jgi:hypothetical protein